MLQKLQKKVKNFSTEISLKRSQANSCLGLNQILNLLLNRIWSINSIKLIKSGKLNRNRFSFSFASGLDKSTLFNRVPAWRKMCDYSWLSLAFRLGQRIVQRKEKKDPPRASVLTQLPSLPVRRSLEGPPPTPTSDWAGVGGGGN